MVLDCSHTKYKAAKTGAERMDRFGQGRRLVRRAMNPNAPMRQTAVRTENLIRVDEVRESPRLRR